MMLNLCQVCKKGGYCGVCKHPIKMPDPIQDLLDRNNELATSNWNLRKENESLRRQVAKDEKEIVQAIRDKNTYASESIKLRERNDSLQEEIFRLEHLVSDARKEKVFLTFPLDIARLEERIEYLENRLKSHGMF